MQQVENVLKIYEGKKLDLVLPSGLKVTIREKNGDDDDTLSPISDSNDPKETLNAMSKFICGIIVYDFEKEQAFMTMEDVMKLKLTDKYYILLKSRIHSDGKILNYQYTCRNKQCKTKTEFKEDLTQYDADFSNYKKTDFEYQVFPHKFGRETECELLLPSGMKVKYEFMTGNGENRILDMMKNNPNLGRNAEFIARNLRVWNEGDWQSVGSFSIFGSMDMRALKKSVSDNDAQWAMISEVECPKCQTSSGVPLTAIADFFFPAGE